VAAPPFLVAARGGSVTLTPAPLAMRIEASWD
jgi:hypothetical protein